MFILQVTTDIKYLKDRFNNINTKEKKKWITIYDTGTHYKDHKPTDAQLTSTKILTMVMMFLGNYKIRFWISFFMKEVKVSFI